MKPYCIYTLGLILLACATLTACMEEEDAELQTQLVVEGWIEDGGYPVVLLGETHAIDAGQNHTVGPVRDGYFPPTYDIVFNILHTGVYGMGFAQ